MSVKILQNPCSESKEVLLNFRIQARAEAAAAADAAVPEAPSDPRSRGAVATVATAGTSTLFSFGSKILMKSTWNYNITSMTIMANMAKIG